MISEVYERLFRRVDREVWVVTACDGARRGGLLATWVSQASIDPGRPYVLAGLAPNHFTTELIEKSEAFVLHLPTVEQAQRVLPFAMGSGRERDKLTGWEVEYGATEAPHLVEISGRLECRVKASLDGGDRRYFWAEAVGGTVGDSGRQALTERKLIEAANDEQRALLRNNRELDAALHGPWFERWLREVSAGASQITAATDRS